MPRTGGCYVPALGFGWLTPAYDWIAGWGSREKTVKTALLEQANLAPAHEVLDVGCGTGTLAIWAKERHPGPAVTGLDADPKVLAIASRKAAKAGVSLRLHRGLSMSLPYAGGRFDRVLSTLLFHHLSLPEKRRTAGEIHRVLRPGGELHVADWGRASGPLMRGAFLAVQLVDGFGNTRDNVNGRLPGLFEEAGFSGVSETGTFATAFGTLSLYRAFKGPKGRGTRDLQA